MGSSEVIRAMRVLALGGITVLALMPGVRGGRGAVVEAQWNADQQTPSASQPGGLPGMPPHFPDDPMQPRPGDRLKAMNDDRHKRLETDADKLLTLATELKTDVDKSGKDELSLDVIRRAQEIEKLAHDVQNRMRG